MDVCKACHEKDRNVTNCPHTLAMHIGCAGFVTKCDICGIKGQTVYTCYGYDAHVSHSDSEKGPYHSTNSWNDPFFKIRGKNNENMCKMPQ